MAVALRPTWSGYLKLSLVTIAVRLYPATSERDRIRFHQIHEPSGERVRQQLVVPGVGPVERDDIVKGYEYEKGHYVTVAPDDLKRLRLETTDTIDIVEFVEDIDPIYFAAPYYLVPDGGVAEEGYRVIREALRQTGKTAIGQVVINGQERVVGIRPLGRGLLGNALRYQDEIRKPEMFFDTVADARVDEDQLAIMEQIIARKSRPFDPGRFHDRYQTAVRELIEEKLAGKLPAKPAERPTAQVINLMDALKRSLAEEEAAKVPASGRAAAVKKSAAKSGGKAAAPSSQRSLLLPVDGGGRKPRPAAAETPQEPAKKRRKA